MEGLPDAEALAEQLQFQCEVELWKDGFYELSKGTLETLVSKVSTYDFAVVVLSADDVTTKRGKTKRAPRDNAIFELGLFMGALGRERVYVAFDRSKDLDILSDFAGVTAAQFSPNSEGNRVAALAPAANAIRRQIERLGVRNGQLTTILVTQHGTHRRGTAATAAFSEAWRQSEWRESHLNAMAADTLWDFLATAVSDVTRRLVLFYDFNVASDRLLRADEVSEHLATIARIRERGRHLMFKPMIVMLHGQPLPEEIDHYFGIESATSASMRRTLNRLWTDIGAEWEKNPKSRNTPL